MSIEERRAVIRARIERMRVESADPRLLAQADELERLLNTLDQMDQLLAKAAQEPTVRPGKVQ